MTKLAKRAPGRPPTIEAPRQTILAYAARLFAENGYEQTSLQDVAASVGMSKAAVYHYFPTKQTIYDEIVFDLLGGLLRHVRAGVDNAGSDVDRLQAFMVAHADYFEDNYISFVTLLHGVGGIGRAVTDKRQIEVRNEYEALLRTILANGVANGSLVIDDVRMGAIAVLSMLNWMSRWYRPGGEKRAHDVAEHYFRILYSGFRPTDPSETRQPPTETVR